jgi:hypothetical protein
MRLLRLELKRLADCYSKVTVVDAVVVVAAVHLPGW